MIIQNGALRRTASIAALITGCLTAPPVAAQTAPDKTAAKTAQTDDAAIVVTARRSEESIQSVPVSITAFSGATLRENSVSTPEDIQVNTPGVFLSGSGGRQNANFVIRGQSKALSGPSSPAVISYFADVPNPVFGSYTPQFDMASVQVLKGPQGTLFGRNTTGGAVLFTPAAPSADLEGYVQAGYGNYDNRQIEGVINVPLGDKVRVRLGGVRHLRDGYVTNTLDPKRNLDNIDDYSLRGSILVAPVDGVTNTTIFDFYKSDTNGFSSVLVDVIPGNTLLSILGLQGPFRSRLAAQQARGPFVIDQPRSSYERNRRLGITNKTEIEIGALTLTNIFGYRDTAVAYSTDVGTSRVSADGTGAFPAGTPVDLIVASLNNSVHQYSDELQLRGKLFDDKLNWLVGGFYIRSNPSGPQSNLVGFAQIPGFENGRTAYNFITEDSRAVFGHLTYDFAGIDGLQLEAGLRYTKDKIQSCTGVGPSAAGDDVQPNECLSKLSNAAVTKADSSAATWSVGMNWQANDNVFTYLVTRRGYRAGGVNSPNFTGRLVPFQVFSPETVTDIEAGIRTDFEAGSVKFRFNASAFVGWYKNVQTALTGVQSAGAACTPGIDNPAPISPDGDCDPNNDPAGGTLLVNLGTSRVSGIDLDGLIRLSDGLSFNYGASFLRPVTTSFTAPPAIAAFVANNTIPFNFATRTTVTAGVRYKLPLPESVGEIVFNADYYWSDKLPFSGTFSPSYDLVNARLDWNAIAGSPIDVSVFSRNLFNKEYQSTGAAAGAFLGFTTAIYAPPRTFGVELRYRFGQ
jgi:iron complex outermembrane receptor protein